MEGGAFARFAGSCNKAIMFLCDFLTECQADTCACVVMSSMQSLKQRENDLAVLRFETDAIVLESDLVIVGIG